MPIARLPDGAEAAVAASVADLGVGGGAAARTDTAQAYIKLDKARRRRVSTFMASDPNKMTAHLIDRQCAPQLGAWA